MDPAKFTEELETEELETDLLLEALFQGFGFDTGHIRRCWRINWYKPIA